MNREVKINMKKVNMLTILLQILLIIILPLLKISQGNFNEMGVRWYMITYLIAAIFIHELLHGIGIRYVGKAHWKDIKYSYNKKYMMPHFICKDLSMTKEQYIKIMLLPNIILTALTLIIMLTSSNFMWSIIAAFIIALGGTDYYLIYKASKLLKETKLMDNSEDIGFIILN